MTPQELLATICEELGIDTAGIRGSNKSLVDALNAYLLEQHALGRRVVVVIDEAQNLSPDALEQVRLLTNLETAKEKLMQVVLLGQPELRQLLQRQNLRQLAQRVTARYHLAPLDREETRAYVLHRMKVAGAPRNPFRRSALRALYRRSGGIPRLINIIADRSLAAAYAGEKAYVTERMVNAAAQEVRPSETRVRSTQWPSLAAAAAALLLAVALVVWGPWTADRPGSGAAAEPRVADTLEPEQPADGTDRARHPRIRRHRPPNRWNLATRRRLPRQRRHMAAWPARPPCSRAPGRACSQTGWSSSTGGPGSAWRSSGEMPTAQGPSRPPAMAWRGPASVAFGTRATGRESASWVFRSSSCCATPRRDWSCWPG
jgi:general secretion pathway protein A